MKGNIPRIAALLLLLAAALAGLAAFPPDAEAEEVSAASGLQAINTYRDIPGVTEEEINAIEALKSARGRFSHGSVLSREAFILPNGAHAGFAALLRDHLAELFGVPFVPRLFGTRADLKNGLDNGTLDFAGDLAFNPEHRQAYFMTRPLEERPLGVFSLKEAPEFQTASDLSGLTIGYFDAPQSVLDTYPNLHFKAVKTAEPREALEKLESGAFDAFFADVVSSLSFNERIRTSLILPLVHTPVSLSAASAELAPVISVLDKYLVAGGVDRLRDLYLDGGRDYDRHALGQLFTAEERAYLAERGGGIPIVLEHDNYPASFYNRREKEFQGIAPDILREISLLTGMEFTIVNDENTLWEDTLGKLAAGEAALISELLETPARQGKFLFSSHPYAAARYALLSRHDYPYLEMFQVVKANVGTFAGTAYDEVFQAHFPAHPQARYYLYELQHELFGALERGEIDLAMVSEYALASLRNYFEKSGYKANIILNSPIRESYFGFHLGEGTLRSIFDKAMPFVDLQKIEYEWKHRAFDYEKKLAAEQSKFAEQRLFFISIFAVILAVLLVALAILLIKNNKARILYKNQAITISAMYDASHDLIYSKGISGRYATCNRSFTEFTGLGEAEIIGKLPVEIITPAGAGLRSMATDRKVLAETAQIKAEDWFNLPHGALRLFETIKTPLIRDGKVTGLLGVMRDITGHQETLDKTKHLSAEAVRAANEASRAKSAFLAHMSHEIRTPMNAIMGMTELALRENRLDAAREHIFTVRQSSANLLSIIDDILDLSKIESGTMKIITADYLFSSMLNDIISIIRMRIMDSPIRFVVNVDHNIPNALHGDETRIRQILINLLGNAVKYTEKGFVALSIQGDMAGGDTISLTIEVADSGRGIRPEDLDSVFVEYFQIKRDKNRFSEGVGLGLPITRHLVKMMDGDISAKSEYGRGSTFTVTLPQKIHRPQKLAEVENPASKSVLIYEPRTIYANSLFYTLDNLGAPATLALGEAELLEALAASPYSFIFTSPTMFEKNRDAILEAAADSKIVLLCEFGEALPDQGWSTLALPAYAVSVANILNGLSGDFTYNTGLEPKARFVAPEALILTVDDINTNLRVIEGLLLPYQVRVESCRNGLEALEAVQTKRYDLVFMDHKMPKMDGVEATRRIRALEPLDRHFADLPIIALTANAISGMREFFLDNGFNDLLTKPIDIARLNAMLELWLPEAKRISTPAPGPDTPAKAKGEAGLNIGGLDTGKGLYRAGGTDRLYFRVLEAFCEDGRERFGQIGEHLKTGDLDLYALTVHALKSAAANIGADELAATAEALEHAGARGDRGYIETHNESFLAALESLLGNIQDALAAHYESREAPLDLERFRSELALLREALKNIDSDAMTRAADNLRAMPLSPDLAAQVASLSNHIIMADYDQAGALIDSLLEPQTI